MAHDALVAVLGLQIGMLAEKVCNLGHYCLGKQGTRPIAQDFGELILDVSWLNQLDDVIFRHGISLLRWRSGGVKHPHDMPPFRFTPSPTLAMTKPEMQKKATTPIVPRSTGICLRPLSARMRRSGVKWNVQRGCRASHWRTFGCLWVA